MEDRLPPSEESHDYLIQHSYPDKGPLVIKFQCYERNSKEFHHDMKMKPAMSSPGLQRPASLHTQRTFSPLSDY